MDAGYVAEALLGVPHIRSLMLKTLGIPVASLRKWLPFWVALHDLGKISAPFQYKRPELCRFDGSKFPDVPASAKVTGDDSDRHERASQYLFGYPPRGPGLLSLVIENERAAQTLALITGTHHGRAYPVLATGKESRLFSAAGWPAAQAEAFDVLRGIFYKSSSRVRMREPSVKGSICLAGFLALCDWIASNSGLFPLEAVAGECPADPEIGVDDYSALSKSRAKSAVETSSLFAMRRKGDRRPPKRISSWKDAFKDGEGKSLEPYSSQKAVMAAVDPNRQFMAIICDSMGRGKTETGIWLGEASRKTRGTALCLPTRATGDGIYSRILKFVDDAFPGIVVPCELVHSLRVFSKDRRSRMRPWPLVMDDSGLSATTSEFFGGKKGLLADYCVTTADQVALGCICSRFFFFRLFALGGKTIIFDEIHAYDAYTRFLISATLPWLKALGCNVVVMSATLPAAAKRSFVEAWGGRAPRGLARYPSCVVSQGLTTRVVALPPSAPRDYDIRWTPDLAAGLARVRSMTTGGGAALVYVNTVKKAQAAYDDMIAHGAPADDLICAHSMDVSRRKVSTEAAIRSLIGKNGRRPKRLIVICTQVCELSLDIDADVVLSEICPIDILLQRLGRLQRFLDIPRLPIFSKPTLLVTKDGDGIDKTLLVYDKYLIQKTIDLLAGRGSVSVPSDVQSLVEGVYGPVDGARPGADDSMDEYVGSIGRDTEKAGIIMTCQSENPSPSSLRVDDEGRPRTFLGMMRHYDSIRLDDDIDVAVRDISPKRKMIALFERHGKTYATENFDEEVDVNSLDPEMGLANSFEIWPHLYGRCSDKNDRPLSWEQRMFLRFYQPEYFHEEGGRLMNRSRKMELHPKKGIIMLA
jgi:CRISPR-associated endonuclease/helicase Cas3